MKTFLKVLGILVLFVIISAYLAFLFVVPKVVKLDNYIPQVKQLAKDYADINFNIEKLEVVTKPNLYLGVETGNVEALLPDNSPVISANNISAGIFLPQILVLRPTATGKIESPVINLDIENGKQYKVVSHFEKLLNKNSKERVEKTQTTNPEPQLPSWFNPKWIKFVISNFNIDNYKVVINDSKNGHSLTLRGDNLVFGTYNLEKAYLKTNAKFYSDDNNTISANIDLNSFLPDFKMEKTDEDDAIEVKVPFVNPVSVYRKYNLKTNIDSKLKIRNTNGKIKAYGYTNIENLSVKLSGLQLPDSYLRFRAHGSKIETDTNIYFAKNQNLRLLGKADYLAPNMDFNVVSQKIYFNDMIILARAILDTIGIKNDFSYLYGAGYFTANANIKTDFKKLKSNGSILVTEGKIASNKKGLVVDKMNIILDFKDNALSIPKSSAKINGKTLDIKGKIDKEANADVKITMNQLPLAPLFNVFAPVDIRKQYNLTSGNLSLNARLHGALKSAVATLKIKLTNFEFSDKNKNFIISDEILDANFTDNFNLGLIKNKNLKIFIPMSKSVVLLPQTLVYTDLQDINIPKSLIKVNDNSKAIFYGEIKNYLNNPNINIAANGNMVSEDLRKFAGDFLKTYIDAKGSMPFTFCLNGTSKKQDINFELASGANGYLTPVHMQNLKNKDTVLNSNITIRGNHIKIKDTGVFFKQTSKDFEDNIKTKLVPIVEVSGTIVGDYINKIALNIPNELNGTIYAFKNSMINIKPSKLYIWGDAASPKFKGDIRLENIIIPQLYASLNSGIAKFDGKNLQFILSKLVLNDSDFHIKGDLSLIPSEILNVSNLDVKSKKLDVDKIMKVSDAVMNLLPKSENTPSGASAADIPVSLKNGKIIFREIKTGNIILKNTVSKIEMVKNILYINKMSTKVFNGEVKGDISVNLLTMLINAKLSGSNINMEKMLLDAANLKDALNGTTFFKTDISLCGTTYEEQVKSLKGKIAFDVKNGQFGPFGKLENMILAENIRESEFFKTAIGSVLNSLLTIDTTHFSSLAGVLSFNDGFVTLVPVTSKGDVLTLQILGSMDLLQNKADFKVRSKLASQVSDLLGPLSAINPVNLVKNTPGLNVVLAKTFTVFCEQVTKEEEDNLPKFEKKRSELNATKFQIVLRGDVNKPFTLVKSFKWLATKEEMASAQAFVDTLVIPEEEMEGNIKNVSDVKENKKFNWFKKKKD